MNGTFMTNKQTKNKVELPKIGSSDQYNNLIKIIQINLSRNQPRKKVNKEKEGLTRKNERNKEIQK